MQTVELPDGGHYGRVVRDAGGRVLDVLQTKDAADRPDILAIREINTGAYCFDAAVPAPAPARAKSEPGNRGDLSYRYDSPGPAPRRHRGGPAGPGLARSSGHQQPQGTGRGHPDPQNAHQRGPHGCRGHPGGPRKHLYRPPGGHRPGHGRLPQRLPGRAHQ